MKTKRKPPYPRAAMGALSLSCLLSACEREPGRQSVFDSMACEACAIVLERVAELGVVTDTVWPTRHTTVVQDRAGFFFAGITDHPGILTIYSPTGEFLRTFGRRGQGPGEYDSPLLILHRGPSDTIRVIDVVNGGLTVIDSTGGMIRAERLTQPGFENVAWLQDGRVIVVANIRTPELIGKPLHEVGPDGRVIRSFGEFSRYTNPEVHGIRMVAAARDGGLWVAFPNRYRVEYYDAQLRLARELEFDVPWFPPWDAFTAWGERPQTTLTGLWEAPDGLLWVTLRTADEQWEARDRSLDRPEQRISPAALATLNDYLIEVIDPLQGARLASQRFDEPIRKGSGDDLVYSRSERGIDGGIVITAFKPSLQKERLQ